jgi:hypothetical protein
MKPDSMLTTARMIHRAKRAIRKLGPEAALVDLMDREPKLGELIEDRAATIVGKLALLGAPNAVVEGVHGEVVGLCLTALSALRQGHYELWKDTALGERLRQLEPSPYEKSTTR